MAATPTTTSDPFNHHRGRKPLLRETSTFRGHVFVAASLGGFVAANAFLYYLSTGTWFDFSADSYRRALGCALTDMLAEPLSMFSHPWLIGVTGLLLSAVVFVPITLALLYRLWVSALFVLAVAVVGHAPLLAVFLGGACLLAAMTPLRSNQPFLAVLVGLTLVVVYLVLMFYLFFDTQEHALFARDWVMLLPFLLALVAAVAASAIVLGMARLTQYRPGVIWPVLYVFLAAPLLLFYWRIGPVEMDYALLTGAVDSGAGDALFAPATVEEFRRAHPELPDAAEVEDVLAAAGADLERRRDQLLEACRKFLGRYRPNSRAPSILWLRSAVADVCLDEDACRVGLIKYRWVGPTRRSAESWLELAEQYPRWPQAMVAQERLGIDALRDGRVQKAWEYLREAQTKLMAYLARQDQQPAPEESIFAAREGLPGPEYFRSVLSETARILWLMEANKVADDQPANVEAMTEYMRLWPFEGAPSEKLDELAGRFARTDLGDNFRFQWAMAEKRDLARAVKLSGLLEQDTDAAIAANYELGRLALRLGDRPEWWALQLKAAQDYFRRVGPDNPYHLLAQQHLTWLARSRPTTSGAATFP